ncbi:MAG: PspC domain-containing protein [Acidobacteria bacterium]|nr:PspC domain-containing protein [Acidobacteriota bacterium]
MYCTNCGAALGDGDAFCAKCGKPTGVAGTAPGPPPAAVRRLVRPMSEKKVAGVCAGVARYMEVDVTMVRVLWLVVAIFTVVPGFLAYFVMWIAMPKDYGRPTPTEVAVTHS